MRIDPEDPLAALELIQAPEPEARDGWEVVDVRAASLNHHDLWTLGGVGTAAIVLARAAGITVYAASRSLDKRTRAMELGAVLAVEPGERLPERVDAVVETVGRATWGHSLRSLKPGGVIVVSGATTG